MKKTLLIYCWKNCQIISFQIVMLINLKEVSHTHKKQDLISMIEYILQQNIQQVILKLMERSILLANILFQISLKE